MPFLSPRAPLIILSNGDGGVQRARQVAGARYILSAFCSVFGSIRRCELRRSEESKGTALLYHSGACLSKATVGGHSWEPGWYHSRGEIYGESMGEIHSRLQEAAIDVCLWLRAEISLSPTHYPEKRS